MKWENTLLKERKSIKCQGVSRIVPLSAVSSTPKEGEVTNTASSALSSCRQDSVPWLIAGGEHTQSSEEPHTSGQETLLANTCKQGICLRVQTCGAKRSKLLILTPLQLMLMLNLLLQEDDQLFAGPANVTVGYD